jgi:hypothetical protein
VCGVWKCQKVRKNPSMYFECVCISVSIRRTGLKVGENAKAVSTRRGSQAVPDPSTNRALRRLTSEFGRDPVFSS